MRHPIQNADAIAPFLTSYAAVRTGDHDRPGHYSSEHDMWVIDQNGVIIPLIEIANTIAELATKTDAVQERDDQSASTLAELETKSAASREQDDDMRFAAVILELGTKTKVELEQDDDSVENLTQYI